MTVGNFSTMASTTGFTVDPYRFPGAVIDDFTEPACAFESGDFLLSAPDPGQRVSLPLEPADRRRLDLHAALTAAGIAPLPGDLEAIEALCALDDATHLALRRWISRAL